MKTIISEDNSIDKYHVITLVSENLDNFKTIAQKTIYDNGYDYPVEIGIGNFSFPTKKYGDISLPSGYYDALQIKIGNAEGKNWWCVLYPNLCFTDVTTSVLPEDSMEILKNTLTDEEYNVIIDNSENIKIKFKFIEIFQSVKEKLSK
jgi:stage II sporulation protein R